MHNHLSHLFFVLFLSLLGAALSLYLPPASLILLPVLVTIWALSYKPTYGLYVLLFLYPMLGWQIDLADYPWLAGTVFGSFNAPVADFWAVMLLASFGIFKLREHGKMTIKFPGLFFFLLFVLSALLSLMHGDGGTTIFGLKYLLRNIIFIYCAYVVLPANLLTRATEIRRGIAAVLSSGVIAIFFGIASLFVLEPFWGEWRRVNPFAIGGWAPFGFFHNDLAEVFVTLLPLAVYWYYQEKRVPWKKAAFLYCVVLFLLTLLTFSRTAWVVMIFETIAVLALVTKRAWHELKETVVPFAALLLIPIGMYMFVMQGSSYVAASTTARVDLTRIALFAFQEHPVFGNGIGSYINLVARAEAFRIEYGPPFDAHGVVQKLAAEQGLVGIATFFLFIVWIMHTLYRAWHAERQEGEKALLLAACILVLGAALYQVFNTQYYTAKMWMPIGLALAIMYATEKKDATI